MSSSALGWFSGASDLRFLHNGMERECGASLLWFRSTAIFTDPYKLQLDIQKLKSLLPSTEPRQCDQALAAVTCSDS